MKKFLFLNRLTGRGKFFLTAALFLSALFMLLYFNQSTDKTTREKKSVNSQKIVRDDGITYLNTSKNVKYVGQESCFPCHRSTSRYWYKAEMSRSMEDMSDSNIVEVYPQKNPVYDKINDYYYIMFRKNGKFYQKEYRKGPDGKVIHERIMEAEYSVGSGNNLRMYFYSESGMFYQLPLTWNSHKKSWDLSPGFREYKNLRFSRYAAKKCVFCHNSYLRENTKAPDRYKKPYEIGISCERCHGPGELHIKEENRETSNLPDSVRTIINPKNLSINRQMAICMQCHLEGKAWVLQDENGWFDFRPGQLLSDNRSVYYPAITSKEAIEVGDSPHRLMLSRCYKESNGKLSCLNCHDPHKSIHTFTRKHYNNVCLSCHKPNKLPGFGKEHVHKKNDDCISCHMNRTGTENTLHGVSLTDHWIRIDANKTKIDWSGVRHPEKRSLIELVAQITNNDSDEIIRKGIAYYEYHTEYDNRNAYLDSALIYLRNGIRNEPNSYRGYFYLGKTYSAMGKYEDALSAFNKSIKYNKHFSESFLNAGRIYKLQNKTNEAILSFRNALALKPEDPSYMEQLGFALYNDDKINESLKYLSKALEIDNQNPKTYFILGNIYALKLNRPEKALEYFKKSVYLDPDIEDGYLNLGNTYALLNKFDEAVKYYNLYLYKNPESVSTLINLGRVYEVMDKKQKAAEVYKRALAIDPQSAEVQKLLNNIK